MSVAARQTELNKQHEDVIKQLDTLKQIESHLYQNLQSLNNDSSASSIDVDNLKKKIKDLVDVRKGLFSQLNNMYSYEQKILEKNRRNYVNQSAMASVLDLETENIKKKYYSYIKILRKNTALILNLKEKLYQKILFVVQFTALVMYHLELIGSTRGISGL